MIEAINSSLSNTQFVRGNAERVDSLRSFAANPDRVQEVAPSIDETPVFTVDLNYGARVVQIVDEQTGDVLSQFPTESTLSRRQRVDDVQASQVEFTPPSLEQSQSVEVDYEPPAVNAQAQLASQALAAGEQASVKSLSAGVSFLA